MNSAVPNQRLKMVRINPTTLNSFIGAIKTQNSSPTFVLSRNFNPSPITQIVPEILTIKPEIEVEREVEIQTNFDVDRLKRKQTTNRRSINAYSDHQSSSSSAVSPLIRERPKTVADCLKPEFLSFVQGQADTSDQRPSSKQAKIRNKRLQYCRICERGFKSHEILVKHFYTDHPTITKQEDMFEDPWRCMYCDNWFDGPRRLSYHVKSVHKEALSVKDAVIDNRPQLVECKLCGAVLKSSLIKHTLKAHANEIDERGSDVVKDPRRCIICGKMCSGEQGIRHHLYRTHGSTIAKEVEKHSSEVVNADHLPVLSKRPSINATDAMPAAKRRATSPIVVEGYDESFEIAEETVITETNDQRPSSQATDEATYCEVCQLDLMNPVHFLRHVELRHKPIACPICRPVVWCKGQIGLESHDDSVHRGLIRLQAATSLT